jgi:hypothetical protein
MSEGKEDIIIGFFWQLFVINLLILGMIDYHVSASDHCDYIPYEVIIYIITSYRTIKGYVKDCRELESKELMENLLSKTGEDNKVSS